MSTSTRTTVIGEFWLTAAIAVFAIGLLVALDAFLGGLSIGVDGAMLSIPPVAKAAVLGGTLGAVVLIPGGAVLSIGN